jgi:hypothetical protein
MGGLTPMALYSKRFRGQYYEMTHHQQGGKFYWTIWQMHEVGVIAICRGLVPEHPLLVETFVDMTRRALWAKRDSEVKEIMKDCIETQRDHV